MIKKIINYLVTPILVFSLVGLLYASASVYIFTDNNEDIRIINSNKSDIAGSGGAIFESTVVSLSGLVLAENSIYRGDSSNNPEATASLVILTGGNVGIGTSTPAKKLDVVGAIVSEEYTLTSSASITVDTDNGNQQRVVLAENTTFTLSNAIEGQALRLVVCQDAGGTNTVDWATNILWPGRIKPTETTTGGNCDLFTFTYSHATSSSEWFGASILDF